jgi:hypothetical protein
MNSCYDCCTSSGFMRPSSAVAIHTCLPVVLHTRTKRLELYSYSLLEQVSVAPNKAKTRFKTSVTWDTISFILGNRSCLVTYNKLIRTRRHTLQGVHTGGMWRYIQPTQPHLVYFTYTSTETCFENSTCAPITVSHRPDHRI